MPVHPEKFAQLLSEGIHRVRIAEFKAIQIVQDELGHALGRDGGSALEYWRKGHVPGQLAELETLAREIVRRGHLERAWLEKFLQSAGHPKPERLCTELFGPADAVKQTPRPKLADTLPEQLAPFVVGPPIVYPRQFFGREAELRRIFHVWQQYPLQNVAVIGPRRSGKTSLLHYVKNITTTNPAQLRKDQFARWLPQPERFRWVYVDFQDARMGQQERLLRHILTSLALPLPTPCDLGNFLDVMIDHLQTPTVIMLDEIGAALAAPELDLQFWWSLRSLSTNLTAGNLAFLLAAHALPMQLAQEQGKPSPFFNIFGHVLKLGPLSEAAAHDLIASSPKPFAPADVTWLLEQSQGWPFLLQMLCDTRLTALEEGATGDDWQAEALTRLEPYRYLIS